MKTLVMVLALMCAVGCGESNTGLLLTANTPADVPACGQALLGYLVQVISTNEIFECRQLEGGAFEWQKISPST